ncbi:MAG: hypothetical protein WA761_09395 [Thermoplasmata archaeon]
MGPFRATDEQIDHEIATLERIARQRVRRYARDLSEVDRDLKELKKERARRRAANAIPGSTSEKVVTGPTTE